MVSLVEILIAVVTTIVGVVYWRYRIFSQNKEKLKFIPGPKNSFPLGCVLDFSSSEVLLSTLERYFDEYGDICKAFIGPFRIVLPTANYKLVEATLNSTKYLHKSWQYNYFRNWLGEGLLTSEPLKWRKHRKVFTPAFHFQVLEKFALMFEAPTSTLIKILKTKTDLKSFDIFHNINLCSLDVMCETSMGLKLNVQENEDCDYVNAVKDMGRIIVERSTSALKFSDFSYRFTSDYYTEKKALKVLHGLTNSMIRQKREEVARMQKEHNDNTEEEYYQKKRKLSFLEVLLFSKVDGKLLDDESIREEVDTFLFEGHDTTTSGVSFTLYCLANNPDIQKKALEEQTELFGNEKNPKVQLADLQEMKYLELVIKESMRLYPPVPIFGRSLVEDLVADGVVYPKGMDVVISAYRIHRNPELFPNPNDFIPTRFLEMGSENPFAYIPFSAGPRNCIGQKFAMLEMKYVISSVLRNFELLPADPHQDLQLVAHVILRSLNGVNISIKERS